MLLILLFILTCILSVKTPAISNGIMKPIHRDSKNSTSDFLVEYLIMQYHFPLILPNIDTGWIINVLTHCSFTLNETKQILSNMNFQILSKRNQIETSKSNLSPRCKISNSTF